MTKILPQEKQIQHRSLLYWITFVFTITLSLFPVSRASSQNFEANILISYCESQSDEQRALCTYYIRGYIDHALFEDARRIAEETPARYCFTVGRITEIKAGFLRWAQEDSARVTEQSAQMAFAGYLADAYPCS